MPGAYRMPQTGQLLFRTAVQPPIGTFTMMCWFTPSGSSTDRAILKNGTNAAGSSVFYECETDSAGTMKLELFNGSTTSAVGTTVMATGKWYHIAITVDLTANKFLGYVNGVLEVTHTANAGVSAGAFYIGSDSFAANDGAPGDYGAIKVWGRVLTQPEIARERRSALAWSRTLLLCEESLPLGWEGMDAPVGAKSRDSSPAHNPLQLSGSPARVMGPPIRYAVTRRSRPVAPVVAGGPTRVRRFTDDGGKSGSRLAA